MNTIVSNQDFYASDIEHKIVKLLVHLIQNGAMLLMFLSANTAE